MSVGIKYRPTEGLELSADAGNIESAFQFIAYCDSIFKIDICGNCGKPGPFKFIHRTPKGNDFSEIQCPDCHHSLKLSKTKLEKKLYPKGWEEPYRGGNAQTTTETNPDVPAEQPQTTDSW
jgi:hypothetical protein